MRDHPVYQQTRKRVIAMAIGNLVDEGYQGVDDQTIFSDGEYRKLFLDMVSDPENSETGDSVSDQVIKDLIQELGNSYDV